MLLTLVTACVAIAALGGLALVLVAETSSRRWIIRWTHAAFGVVALVGVFAGAHDAGIAAQGPTIGLLGFATASGGLLFRQRTRAGATTRPARLTHAALGLASLGLLIGIGWR